MDRLATARVLSLAALVGGVALLVLAAVRGEARLYLVLVFPVVTGEGAVFALGTLLLMAGIVLAFLSWAPMMAHPAEGPPQAPAPATPPSPSGPVGPEGPAGEGGTRWGGVVFIGPVPIAFGSAPRTTALMLAAAVVMGLLLLVFVLGALLRGG
jgi:uncharacterized protein (TIGR00304 family)